MRVRQFEIRYRVCLDQIIEGQGRNNKGQKWRDDIVTDYEITKDIAQDVKTFGHFKEVSGEKVKAFC